MDVLNITETDTLKVRIAPLAIIDLRLRWMIQIVEPILLIEEEYYISHNDAFVINSQECITDVLTDVLKNRMLDKWKTVVKDFPDDHFFKTINKVELIECDLMVPKVEIRSSSCSCDCDGGCVTCKD